MNKQISDLEEKKEKIAQTIMKIWEILESFDEEDVKILEDFVQSLRKQNEELLSIGGLFVDLDKAQYKRKLNSLIIKRTNALITLIKNKKGKKDLELAKEYIQKISAQEKIDKIFGLNNV